MRGKNQGRARIQPKCKRKNVLPDAMPVVMFLREAGPPRIYLPARLATAQLMFLFVFRPILSQLRICAVTASAIESLAFSPMVGRNTDLKSTAIPIDGCATISAGFNGFARHTGRASTRTLSTGHLFCSSRSQARIAGRTWDAETSSSSNGTNASHSRPPTRRILAIRSPRMFGTHGRCGDREEVSATNNIRVSISRKNHLRPVSYQLRFALLLVPARTQAPRKPPSRCTGNIRESSAPSPDRQPSEAGGRSIRPRTTRLRERFPRFDIRRHRSMHGARNLPLCSPPLPRSKPARFPTG
jgi:hypothetical protein